VLTFAYSARFLHGAFATKRGVADTTLGVRAAPVFVGPAIGLAVLSIAAGLLPIIVDELVNVAVKALDTGFEGTSLELWHGFNLALGLSALTVALGLALFAGRGRVERWQAAVPALPSAQRGFDRSVNGLLFSARRLTGVMQNGSLPVYLSVILLTMLVLPGSVLATKAGMAEWPVFAANPLQMAITLIVIVAAVATTAVGRRFSAVLLLGAVGYGVAALFVVQGAPDLALTQFLVETLSLVIFVLVLRHLPDRFTGRQASLPRALRGLLAAGVGIFVFVFTLVAGASRSAPPVSLEYVARALPEAEGRNIVNVILVDFRALDTLGEIVVLVTAALGIATLVMATRLGLDDQVRREAAKDATPGAAQADGP
jgi:multicomponent Na+:H+ antiporter subunit A